MSIIKTLTELTMSWTGQKSSQQVLPFVEYEKYMKMRDGTFRMILKVSAINNDLLEEDENDQIIEYMQEAINATENELQQITVSSERMNMDDYLQYLEDKYEETRESFFLERLDAMLKYVRRNSKSNQNKKSYYFTISTRHTDLERVHEDFGEIYSKIREALSSGEIEVELLSGHAGLNLMYEKLNPRTSLQQPYSAETGIRMVAPVPMIHREDHSLMDGLCYKFYVITDYPTNVDPAWMLKVFDVRASIDVSIFLDPTSKRKVIEGLDDSLGQIRYQLNKGGMRESEKLDLESKEKSAQKLLQELSQDSENMFNVTTLITVKGKDMKDLEKNCDRVRTVVQTAKMKSRSLDMAGNDAFWMSLPIAFKSNILKHESVYWPMQSSIIGSILPFNSSDFMMKKGVIKGRNPKNDGLIIVDRRDRDKVDNSNEVVIAPSGRGKTWYAEADIIRESAQGTKIVVIDPDREYNLKHGERVIFSIGSPYCTNPFHIRSAILDLDDDEDGEQNQNLYVEDVGQFLQRKIGDLIPFFRWIYPAMDSTEAADLELAIRRIYEEKSNLNFSSKVLPERFPTLSDLDEMIEKNFKDTLSTLQKNIRPFVHGIYTSMFNGQTNWSLEKQITVLDINTLSDEIQKPMMHLLLMDLWEMFKRDRDEKKGLYVDEAWKLASPDNPQTLKFLFTIAKRIRKYGGYLTTITQQVEDFFNTGQTSYGKAIFSNAFFKMFLGLDENDHTTLTKIGFKFSRREQRILLRRKSKGRGVYVIGSQRVEVQTTPLLDELQFIAPKEYQRLSADGGAGDIDVSETRAGAV